MSKSFEANVIKGRDRRRTRGHDDAHRFQYRL